jgi:predicted small lipoprotein YifL
MTKMLRRRSRFTVLLLACGALAGCGQMGPLTLPESGAAASTDDQDENRNEDGDDDRADDER